MGRRRPTKRSTDCVAKAGNIAGFPPAARLLSGMRTERRCASSARSGMSPRPRPYRVCRIRSVSGSLRSRPWRRSLGLEPGKRRDYGQPSFRAIIGWHDDCPLRGNDIWPGTPASGRLRKAMAAFNAHLVGDRPIAEVEFRLRVRGCDHRWVDLVGKIMERDASGKPPLDRNRSRRP